MKSIGCLLLVAFFTVWLSFFGASILTSDFSLGDIYTYIPYTCRYRRFRLFRYSRRFRRSVYRRLRKLIKKRQKSSQQTSTISEPVSGLAINPPTSETVSGSTINEQTSKVVSGAKVNEQTSETVSKSTVVEQTFETVPESSEPQEPRPTISPGQTGSDASRINEKQESTSNRSQENTEPIVSTKRLDHLGIIAGLCDEIGLVELIDKYVGPTGRKVSVGLAVKAMIINALGFVGRPLYLTPEFFANKPVDVLFGDEYTAEDFNDDSLGRALDFLFEAGLTECFALVSSHALEVFKIIFRFVHADTSTYSLHGQYEDSSDDPDVIKIKRGHSKAHRPDLKQAVIALITVYQSSIPTWFQSFDGNESDKNSLPEIIQAYVNQLKMSDLPYFIADCALYSAENIKKLSKVKWITRVPETIAAVKHFYLEIRLDQMEEADQNGYLFLEIGTLYGGIQQRWLIVYSKKLYQQEMKTFRKKLAKEKSQANESLKKLSRKEFDSPEKARAALESLSQKWRHHKAQEIELKTEGRYSKPGRPKDGQKPDRFIYHIQAQVIEDKDAINDDIKTKGKFILATNELDKLKDEHGEEIEKLSNQDILTAYKAQPSSVERGFRFLNDPMFFADSLFLKTPERIMALLMIMGLALLVYSLAERKLRTELVQRNETLPNQLGKETQRITMRRTFQIFEGIDILIEQRSTGPTGVKAKIERRVINLKPIHYHILDLLGPEVKKYYLLDIPDG